MVFPAFFVGFPSFSAVFRCLEAKHKAIFGASNEPERAKGFVQALPEALAPLGGVGEGDMAPR